jgi:hypothetical protein
LSTGLHDTFIHLWRERYAKQPRRLWVDVALNLAGEQGLEAEVEESYEAAIDAGHSELQAVLIALKEWDIEVKGDD